MCAVENRTKEEILEDGPLKYYAEFCGKVPVVSESERMEIQVSLFNEPCFEESISQFDELVPGFTQQHMKIWQNCQYGIIGKNHFFKFAEHQIICKVFKQI